MKVKQYGFSQLTIEKINQVRKIFLVPEVLTKFPILKWNTPNISKILELMCEDHTLNKERVKNNFSKLTKNYDSCKNAFRWKKFTQKSLEISNYID